MGDRRITAALAGNPNSGKTTLFNALTGARQHVGNYPGVTVEKKEGRRQYKGCEIEFVDLPGTYSLSAYSIEEIVARDFLVEERPDVVVHVVDCSNLERNLYLTTQLAETGLPVILAFNMSDVAAEQGLEFDLETLAGRLGCPIVLTVGNKSKGIGDLLERIVETGCSEPAEREATVRYSPEIESALGQIEAALNGECRDSAHRRWFALKLLEQDQSVLDRGHRREVVEAVARSAEQIQRQFGDEPDLVIADQRYQFISQVCGDSVHVSSAVRRRASDAADRILLNRILGLPIFAGLMYLVFKLTFTVGDPLMGAIETFFGWLGAVVSGLWPAGTDSALHSLVVDGIIGGVGGVIVFLPNILLLFLAISLLEDSGYMARAAFLMDRIMHRMGLHGKSFIPMLIGFGCSIPAILGTRILENRHSRLTTILVIPLMSCGARLPIYALIIPAFFAPRWQGLMLWLIYVIGIVLAVVGAKLLRSVLLKGETVPFVMELPPYRLPTVRGVLQHVWERSRLYLQKAGTVILAISVVLWALTNYPKPPEERIAGLSEAQAGQVALEHSIAGRMGRAMEPVIRPMGFDYRIGTALIGALAAKEVFVAQMGIVYSMGEADEESEPLRDQLKADYSALQGFCIMLFCLISAPCVATLAVCRRETGSWKWPLLQFGGLTVTAYAVTGLVYQVGKLFY